MQIPRFARINVCHAVDDASRRAEVTNARRTNKGLPSSGASSRFPARLGILTAGLLLAALPAAAQGERILSFHSDIAVHSDASMVVHETITVRAAGDRIQRGIYRDFPTRYKDRLGNNVRVGFEILEVKRDGRPEPHHTERISNGVRIYIGEADVRLPPGEYAYTLVYRTTRQLGFFPDHDELYWNVTGNGWEFEIDAASATVKLPKGIQPQAMILDAYTGPQGSLGTAFESRVTPDSLATFRTTKPLGPREGLTIVVSWPKGFVTPPTREMEIKWFLANNRSTLIGLTGLFLLVIYYVLAWLAVGKDPERGIVMPIYEPPHNLSPADVRYLTRMSFDDKTFGAALLSMAVKRFLTITDKDGTYTLTRASAPETVLSRDEKAMAAKLFSRGNSITLETANHARIRSAMEALHRRLQLDQEKVYFLRNQKYLIPGLAISLLTLIVAAASAEGESRFVALFMTVWLTGWTFGVLMLGKMVASAWRAVRFQKGIKFGVSAAGALFMTAFATPFFLGEAFGIGVLAWATSVTFVVILAVIATLNYAFHHLLKAPTAAGRLLLDRIEGFKMFLAATEGDRMNVLHPPTRTPEMFERYLPYALALGVEHKWSEQFADVLAQSGAGGREYSPSWYSGTRWSNVRPAAFASAIGGAVSTAAAASSSPPGSSSGGRSSSGGGSSGGGGGGGGGGGW